MKKSKSQKRREEISEEVLPVEEPVEEIAEEEAPATTVRCSDCPLKAGLKDEYTLCPTCEGTGQVESSKK